MFRTALLALLLGSAVPLANAQESEPIPPMPLMATCVPLSIHEDFLLAEYGELAFVGGEMIVQLVNGTWIKSKLRLYANPETYTFTLVAEINETANCILGMGDMLGPIIQGEPL